MKNVLFFALILSACSRPQAPRTLPNSNELGSYGSNRWLRVITHMHTPYSFDACDSAPGTNSSGTGTPNSTCLSQFREAICRNRVDFTFTTDHQDFFKAYSFNDVLLFQTGDSLVNSGLGTAYYNRLGGCDSGGFVPILSAGFESLAMIGIGLKTHLSPASLYDGTTSTTRTTIQGAPYEGVVIMPHLEDKDVANVNSVGPDAVEIYNLHANLDPKIRKKSLGALGYLNIGSLVNYILDPYNDLVPDLAFVSFLEQFPVYSTKWVQLMALGLRPTGVAAVDSHQNVLSLSLADGERFDSFRRTSKIASNLVAAASSDIDLVKAAIKANRVLVAFEGFGSPVNFDFSIVVGSTTYRMGESVTLGSQTAIVTVRAPALHSSSLRGPTSPVIRLQLKKMNSDGTVTVVSETTNSILSASVTTTGIYHVEVKITPYHLKEYLGAFSKHANIENTWIISNPIYLN